MSGSLRPALFFDGSALRADAAQHTKLTRLVVAASGGVEVNFRLVDTVVAHQRVSDPTDVARAPHVA
jgi:hypothetical protein